MLFPLSQDGQACLKKSPGRLNPTMAYRGGALAAHASARVAAALRKPDDRLGVTEMYPSNRRGFPGR